MEQFFPVTTQAQLTTLKQKSQGCRFPTIRVSLVSSSFSEVTKTDWGVARGIPAYVSRGQATVNSMPAHSANTSDS